MGKNSPSTSILIVDDEPGFREMLSTDSRIARILDGCGGERR